MFELNRIINVYETDLMGIVHHSNYLRFCEEARVAWCVDRNLLINSNKAVFSLTVVETRVRHVSPIRFADPLKIVVQVKADKARVIFQYILIVNDREAARAETVHCSLAEDFKVIRLDKNMTAILKEEKWTETWL